MAGTQSPCPSDIVICSIVHLLYLSVAGCCDRCAGYHDGRQPKGKSPVGAKSDQGAAWAMARAFRSLTYLYSAPPGWHRRFAAPGQRRHRQSRPILVRMVRKLHLLQVRIERKMDTRISCRRMSAGGGDPDGRTFRPRLQLPPVSFPESMISSRRKIDENVSKYGDNRRDVGGDRWL